MGEEGGDETAEQGTIRQDTGEMEGIMEVEGGHGLQQREWQEEGGHGLQQREWQEEGGHSLQQREWQEEGGHGL